MSDTSRYCYDVLNVPRFNDESIGYLIHTLEPGNNNQSGLNNSQRIVFNYSGDSKVINLHPTKCGFRVKYAFRTKSAPATQTATNNDKNANITLSSNWFWHLFSNYKLKVANLDNVENLSYPGIFADNVNLFKGSELKNTYGELFGYIPDDGNGEADPSPDVGATCSITKTDLTAITSATDNTGAGTRAFAVTTNTAKWRNYNHGFIKRLARYNYDVTNDDDVRHGEQFIPLSQISGFFSTNTSIMFTNFTIELVRKPSSDYKDAVFGSGTTDMDFGNTNDTGIMSMSLELFEQKPNLAKEAELSSIFENTDKTPKPIVFLKGTVKMHQVGLNASYTMNETDITVPRYVNLLFKGAKNSAAADNNNTADQFQNSNRNFQINTNANLEYARLTLNGQEFPNKSQDGNFLENRFSAFYQDYIDQCSSLSQDPAEDMNNYRDNHFVACFNCSDQNPKVSTKTTNLQVSYKRRTPLPTVNTNRKNPAYLEAYLIILEDCFLQLNAKQNICQSFTTVA